MKTDDDWRLMSFVLEVVRFIRESDEWRAKGGRQQHLGYMRAHFRSREDAASYYDRHNPHMRNLNAHGTWESDPDTGLLYIVREDHHLIATVPPFDPRDEPVVIDTTGGVGSESKWLN